MKPTITLLAAVAAALIFSAATATSAPRRHCSDARAAIRFYVGATHRWQSQHDAPLTPASSAATSRSCRYVEWAARLWRHRAHAARQEFGDWFASTYAKWACIHRHESGNWAIHNPPYDGGLQMDSGFQGTYGSEFVARYGSAGGWPVWAQLLAAERAYSGYHGYGARGYSPWPNTSRACGL